MKAQNNQPPRSDLAKKAERYLKANEVLLQKHKLAVRLIINFAAKKRTPVLSKICLWIVSKQGGKMDMQFGNRQK